MARRPWLLVVLAAVLGAAAPDWTDCPTACRCKWANGKKTALCRDAALAALPATLSSDMQVLDLSGNSIARLPRDAFRSVGLINLQRIYLRGTRLRDLHRDAFRDLIILVDVDLSDNEVSTLHPDTFAGNERLRVLSLSGNPLGELRAAQFPALPHLRTLELERCSLTRVHRDAFEHLAALEALNLRANRLRQLSEAVFMSTGRLNTLALDGNPWRCDCGLRGFRNWYLRSAVRAGVSLTCSDPEALAGRTWASVPAAEFACAPTVWLAPGPVRADQGGNVSFACHVQGDPEPEVTWLFNGRPIGSGNTTTDQTLVIAVEEGLLEKWTNVSVFNVSEADAGEYSCVARNALGAVARNVTLVLPEVVTASTVSKAEPWALWLGVAGGGAVAALVALGAVLAACCACGQRRRRRKRHRRKAPLKGSVSFSDQEKKLLDVSITTTTDRDTTCGGGGGSGSVGRGSSCEMLQADLELLEQSPSIELCEPPVHITIESHQPPSVGVGVGVGVAGEQAGALPVTVFPPPPPEFSSSGVLPAGAFGNIFISVSVSQEAGSAALDVATRYPDLLDVARAREPTVPCAHLATLPRRPCRPLVPGVAGPPMVTAHYDNMGPRVTAGGSSTLSLPDAVGPADDAIPPPPPPPACTPHTGEYVSL